MLRGYLLARKRKLAPSGLASESFISLSPPGVTWRARPPTVSSIPSIDVESVGAGGCKTGVRNTAPAVSNLN